MLPVEKFSVWHHIRCLDIRFHISALSAACNFFYQAARSETAIDAESALQAGSPIYVALLNNKQTTKILLLGNLNNGYGSSTSNSPIQRHSHQAHLTSQLLSLFIAMIFELAVAAMLF